MYQRLLQLRLASLQRQFPAISLVGPRQSGKSTLATMAFPHHFYVSL